METPKKEVTQSEADNAVALDDALKVKIIQRVRSDINKNRVVDLARMRAGQ
ncbi:MAG: hypothetical protein WAN14_16555 [Candidatus Acidiferrales bacterium]